MLYAEIGSLPDDLRSEVADFVGFLKQKHQLKKKIKERQIGGLKGSFIMSPDFDEPMEEFKDYM